MSSAVVRVRRAFIVDRWGRCSWDDYLRSVSIADPAGRRAD